MSIIEERTGAALGRKILCKQYVAELEKELKKKILTADAKIPPTLVIYNTKPSVATTSYIKAKVVRGAKLGINVIVREMADASIQELYSTLQTDIMNGRVHGIILQLPMREDLDEDYWTNLIPPHKDVDGLTRANQGDLYRDEEIFKPCTTEGTEKLIEKLCEERKLIFPRTVIVGRSKLVTKPLAEILQNRHNHTITVCHSKTRKEDLRILCNSADIIVTAAGRKGLIGVKEVRSKTDGKIVIDVSINRNDDGKLCGDLSEEAKERCPIIYTPVPGGVGQLTTYYLMEHVVKAWLDK